MPFTDFASLCRAREVQDLIWSEIEKVNKGFARVETIKKFRLIEHQLTAEDEELTPTMKLKRKFVNEKYKDADREHVRRRCDSRGRRLTQMPVSCPQWASFP